VAITAPCAFVNSIAAFFIGAVAGILVCVSVHFVEHKCRIDDPVGAISVHGVNGVWGILSLGLFADGSYGDGFNGISGTVRGLFYGDASQLWAQLICIGTLIIWGIGMSWLFYKALDKIYGIRVSAEAEVGGLDMPEMGMLAYPDFQLKTSEYDGFDNTVSSKALPKGIANNTVR
jgi:Amt family ammonium transporter